MSRVVVYHRGYGCDTGCCGHVIELDGVEQGFKFSHPYGQDKKAFAQELVEREVGAAHVKDLDWDSCVIIDD